MIAAGRARRRWGIAAALLGLALGPGCGGSPPRSAPASSSPPASAPPGPSTPATGPAPAGPPTAGTATAVTAVVVTHGLMTSVMDSPAGQQDKARDAVERSGLLQQLRALEVTVTVRFDAAVGDDVVVSTPGGEELGRVPLDELARKGGESALIDAVRARR